MRDLRKLPTRLRDLLTAPAPVRPIVIIESDDWGRVGIPSLEIVERLRAEGIPIGNSPWDAYGLETEEDLVLLGDLLDDFRDRDGRSAVVTANFVMANADLRTMQEEGFREFRSIAIRDGFPAPWTDSLADVYLHNVNRGVFYPGLHGFTHFNVVEFLRVLRDERAGRLARALVRHDVPYLASLTPEYNFALVTRRDGREAFLDATTQAEWIMKGVDLFAQLFGFKARTACAPGYRFNATTEELWRRAGVELVQTASTVSESGAYLMRLRRTVHLEPAVHRTDLADAVKRAKRVAAMGLPIIVSSHSINYMTRHVAHAEQGRSALRAFLQLLQSELPDLRFATDADVLTARRAASPTWFRQPSGPEMAYRLSSWSTN